MTRARTDMVLRVGVGWILLTAALSKLYRFDSWMFSMRSTLPSMPEMALTFVVWAEVVFGLALLADVWKSEAFLLAGSLFLAFAGFAVWRAVRGIPDCGCFPGLPSLPPMIHLALNAMLAAACAAGLRMGRSKGCVSR